MRRTAVLGAAAAAALAAGSLAATGVSRLQSPRGAQDPRSTPPRTTRTSTRSPRRTRRHSLTVVANWIPLEEPAGGPYFGKLDPRARYYVKIDNTGDGARGRRLPLEVQAASSATRTRSCTRPAVTRSTTRTSTSSRRTTSTRRRTRAGKRALAARSRSNVPVAPANVGPKTIPNYAASQRGAIRALRGRRQDVRRPVRRSVLRRPRRGVRRHQHRQARPADIGLGNQGGGKDDVAGYNVHSFVLQVPEAEVTRDGKTRRRREGRQRGRRRLGDDRARGASASLRHGKRHGARWVQVSRLGNPLINEVIIPIGQKDKFNRDLARRRPEELRQVRRSTRSRRGS